MRLAKKARASLKFPLVGRPNAFSTATTPRVASERGAFSTNSVCQIRSAFSRLREREVGGGRHARGAEQFGFEVVVGDQLIDAPKPDGPQRRHEEMRVDVDKRGGVEFLFNGFPDLI